MKEDMIKLRKKLEKALDQERFEHSLGVEYTAACLAFIHGANVMDARIAGLLHDCAKCLSDEKKISIMEEAGERPLLEELENHALLHAKAGAIIAKDEYGIKNEDILNAIKYHTLGRPGMSLLEKIIFVADFIEPGRKDLVIMSGVRKAAFVDIDQAVLWIMESVRKYVESKGHRVAPSSVRAYEFYKNQIEPDKSLRIL